MLARPRQSSTTLNGTLITLGVGATTEELLNELDRVVTNAVESHGRCEGGRIVN